MRQRAEFGVFGGSGLYSFFGKAESVKVQTPYGAPSARVALAEIGDRSVAFIPRHGTKHEFPPHTVPYRANVMAFKSLGVTRVIAPNAVGSLKAEVEPGDLVFCDQFVNMTSGRKDTFFDGPETTHVGMAEPYCPQLRKVAVEAAKRLGVRYHKDGTVVVIQGPRFSTKSESRFFRNQGWSVVNMTQYPEVTLAREQEMCYLNISLATDYDVGLEGDPNAKAVSHEQVLEVFKKNMGSLRELIAEIVKETPEKRTCSCGSSLEHARMSA